MQPTPRAEALLRRLRAGTIACVGAYAAYSVARMFGAPGGDVVDSWVYPALIAGAAALCIARCVRVPDERAAWAAFAAGLTSWCLGELYYTVFVQPRAPAFSV